MLPAFVWDLNFMNKHFLITNLTFSLDLDCNFAIHPSLVKLSKSLSPATSGHMIVNDSPLYCHYAVLPF